jgi:hypothetical protein
LKACVFLVLLRRVSTFRNPMTPKAHSQAHVGTELLAVTPTTVTITVAKDPKSASFAGVFPTGEGARIIFGQADKTGKRPDP